MLQLQTSSAHDKGRTGRRFSAGIYGKAGIGTGSISPTECGGHTAGTGNCYSGGFHENTECSSQRIETISDYRKRGGKMTLQQLRYVITVAETGTITEAAQELYISQPSLTNAIHELEKEMNIQIFNRSNKGISISKEAY